MWNICMRVRGTDMVCMRVRGADMMCMTTLRTGSLTRDRIGICQTQRLVVNMGMVCLTLSSIGVATKVGLLWTVHTGPGCVWAVRRIMTWRNCLLAHSTDTDTDADTDPPNTLTCASVGASCSGTTGLTHPNGLGTTYEILIYKCDRQLKSE